MSFTYDDVEMTISSFSLGAGVPMEDAKIQSGVWTDWTIRASGETAGRFINTEVGDKGFIDEETGGKTTKHPVEVVEVKWADDGSVKIGLKRRPEASTSPATT